MQTGVLACCFLLACAVPLGAQSEEADSYSVSVVRAALGDRLGAQKVIHSWNQKHLSRIGDGASVALVKILGQDELVDPIIVRAFLPIIRDSFAEPAFIDIETDKHPKVTLLLLRYLGQNVSETQAQQDIQQTQEYIEEKVRKGSAKP